MVLDDVAAQRKKIVEDRDNRQKELAESIKQELKHKFLLEVVSSEASYTINPSYLPYAFLDFAKLRDRLSEVLHLSLSSISNPLGQSIDEEYLTRNLPSALASGQISSVDFKNGRYEVKGSKATVIHFLELSRERVATKVAGQSDVADALVQDVLEFIWEASGEPRRYSELQQHVQIQKYATSTMVDLGVGSSTLVGQRLGAFLERQCASPEGAFASMFRQSSFPATTQNKPDVIASWALDDLNLRISLFNKSTGESERVSFNFSVIRQSDYGTSRILVSSQLPFDEHIQFLSRVLADISESSS